MVKGEQTKARNSEDFSYTAEEVQGDTIEDRVEFAHVLYMSDQLPLVEYMRVLKKESVVAPKRTENAFIRQVSEDQHWIVVGDKVKNRLENLLNYKRISENHHYTH